jgi:adenylosuccinate lyase
MMNIPQLDSKDIDAAGLMALSPLDGRYSQKMALLRSWLSEFGFLRARTYVEVKWLQRLSTLGVTDFPSFGPAENAFLDGIADGFSPTDADRIKAIEKITNHDVKAVEYFLKEKLAQSDMAALVDAAEFVHFACTSEDINNTSHGLMLQHTRQEVMLPKIQRLIDALRELIERSSDIAMLSRTHGQTASPTTLGKEMANVRARLRHARDQFAAVKILAKMNGAVGNYNAHSAAVPEVAWPHVAQSFVETYLNLHFNPMTIQIEPHDYMAEYFDSVARLNTILIDLCRDVWGYISLGYFSQRLREGEVGSSTMPHKVNPIDFENAEGNLGVANALLRHFSEKLPISRWQRDLTDSTVLRNLGVAIGHSFLAYDSCLRGLQKLEINRERIAQDINESWEVLAEPIQTVMRRHGLPEPYEQLKRLTRGRAIGRQNIQEFVASLDLPSAVKDQLMAMCPSSYTGLAVSLAQSELDFD